MLLLKVLARLVEIALMAAIAAVGLGVGLYCLSGLISLGSGRPDRLLHLARFRHNLGHWLARLATPGSVATLALICGVAAVIAGLALIVGVLGSRRERLLLVERDPARGDLLVRPRTVIQMVRRATLETPGVTGSHRPRLRVSRDGEHGRLRVLASRGPDGNGAAIDQAVHHAVDPIVDPLGLDAEIRVRLVRPREARGGRGGRQGRGGRGAGGGSEAGGGPEAGGGRGREAHEARRGRRR